jgi:para-nitrobenzyl esterase
MRDLRPVLRRVGLQNEIGGVIFYAWRHLVSPTNRRFACHLSLFASLLVFRASEASPSVRVRIVDGVLQGRTDEYGNSIFLGIPYAEPPTGSLRWKPPQPVKRWNGLKILDRFGASCEQRINPQGFGPFTHEFVLENGPVSEDCLFINVWTPAQRSSQPWPVLFWIHGGGYGGGSGSVAIYDGAQLARRGIVVVTFNYRLGPFGFLAYPDLSREAGSSGNYGLMDLIAALRWVKKNIAAFGGDPTSVTIAGQSAGADAVNLLIASQKASGLFIRTIAESGSGVWPFPPSLDQAEKTGIQWAAGIGAKSLADLRRIPAEAILNSLGGPTSVPGTHFGPDIDGQVLTLSSLKTAPLNDTPALTGVNSAEGSAVPGSDKSTTYSLDAKLQRVLGPLATQARWLYAATTDSEAADQARRLERDVDLGGQYVWAADRSSKSHHAIFLYFYTHAEPGNESARYGAFHTSEVPYVFQTLSEAPERPFTDDDRRISETLASYWVNFIKTGDPNDSRLPVWPTFDADHPAVMELGDNFRPVAALSKEKLDLFRRYVSGGGTLELIYMPN